MGHANQIALGLAMACPDRSVCCFDGDGAMLMHMGSLAVIGQSKCSNLLHLVFNNGVHGSVGGQPTVGFNINIPAIAKACGYANVKCVKTSEDLKFEISNAKSKHGPTLIEVRVSPGNRSNIGRPTTTPVENKIALMDFLKG
jgi:phosphonopyruvate decarboxylase